MLFTDDLSYWFCPDDNSALASPNKYNQVTKGKMFNFTSNQINTESEQLFNTIKLKF